MGSIAFFLCEREEHLAQSRNLRYLRDKSNPLELPENMFMKYYRLSKEAFLFVLNKMEEKLAGRSYTTSLPNIIKLSGVLRFFAEGGYQRGTGADYNVAIAQSTFSKVLNELLNFFEAEICPQFIKFDVSEQEQNQTKLNFFLKHDFPGIIGVIDGTHIRIAPPGINTRHLYYNRKGYYSLNVMAVCDDKMRIIYLDSNNPGASHDSFIFNYSSLNTFLQERFTNGNRNSWLLGDAGYALKPYLMTPYRVRANNQNHSGQNIFNRKHTSARNIIERTFGVLKNRFRAIIGERQLHYRPEKAKKIINACVALHNICINYKVPFEEDLTNEEIEEDDDLVEADDRNGVIIRDRIMESFL